MRLSPAVARCILAAALTLTPTLRAGAASVAPAPLAPPSFSWQASPWTTNFKIVRMLVGGSAVERPYMDATTQKLCNGGGTSESGEQWQSCGLRLAKPSDTGFIYIIREFASDATFLRRTECEPMGEQWNCVRKPTQ